MWRYRSLKGNIVNLVEGTASVAFEVDRRAASIGDFSGICLICNIQYDIIYI